MALKRARIEPTVDGVVERCPSAAYRDDTGEAFNKNLILQVCVCDHVRRSSSLFFCDVPHVHERLRTKCSPGVQNDVS